MPVKLRKSGRVAIDEKCVCGHAKSEHGSQAISLPGVIFRHPGKGNCCVRNTHCSCPKFRWNGWIYKDEAKLQCV